jgi:hypothetical protein
MSPCGWQFIADTHKKFNVYGWFVIVYAYCVHLLVYMGDYIHNAQNEYINITFRQKCIVEKSELRNSELHYFSQVFHYVWSVLSNHKTVIFLN